ncbi:MAG: glycosyltransferase family 4 protein [Ruminiclostridium sp.]|nr:glycosyltransferase family 4 protein [Ruminiclostridium sp.]
MSKKVLFIACVAKKHILQFHIPYLRWFKERGYTVHVCAGNDFEKGDKVEIPYCDKYFQTPFYRSPFATGNFTSYKELKKLVEVHRYDIVHCHTPIAAVIARMSLRKERKKGTSMLYTAHGFHFYKGAPAMSKLYYLVEKMMVRHTDGLITINEEDYKAAEKFSRRKKCKVYKIHGIGADFSLIKNVKRTKEQMRAEFGIPDDAFLVMSNSEINENKNITTSIKAVAANKDVYMLVCGSGKLLEECKELAKELSAQDRIKFAGYRFDAKELLNCADAFIFPSHREGLGMAAIEAMAAGLPLIVSDNRGTREYAVQGENALICKADDLEGFTKAIELLSKDKAMCERLGSNGKEVSAKYELSNAVAEMAEIYTEFMTEKAEETDSDAASVPAEAVN